VAGPGARYFSDEKSFAKVLDSLLALPDELAAMRRNSLGRFLQEFTWAKILGEYEVLLEGRIGPE
jgi:glycosyltransferase involved in cell wall biosynthesis